MFPQLFLSYFLQILMQLFPKLFFLQFFSKCKCIYFLSFFFNGAIYSGHTMTGLAMAPNRFCLAYCIYIKKRLNTKLIFNNLPRSGTVMGLSNGFGSIAGIIVPPVKVLSSCQHHRISLNHGAAVLLKCH